MFHNLSTNNTQINNNGTTVTATPLTTAHVIDIVLIIFLATGFICYGGAVRAAKQILHPKRQVHVENYLQTSNANSNANNNANSSSVTTTEGDNSDSAESPR
jgi:hypothetical protein